MAYKVQVNTSDGKVHKTPILRSITEEQLYDVVRDFRRLGHMMFKTGDRSVTYFHPDRVVSVEVTEVD